MRWRMKEETSLGGRDGGAGTLKDEPWCESSCCCCCGWGCRPGDDAPAPPPRGGVRVPALLPTEGPRAAASAVGGREGEEDCRACSEGCRRLSGEAGAGGPSSSAAAAVIIISTPCSSSTSFSFPARPPPAASPSSIRRCCCWDPPERSSPSRDRLRLFSLLLLGPTRVEG